MARGITGYIGRSDIPILDKITHNVAMTAGRNLLIDVLREVFSRDREFNWVGDIWGFNKTPSHIGLDETSGYLDESTTRLYIGSSYRYDIAYLPAITVRQTSMSYRPVSFNQNKWELEYRKQKNIDGYGEVTILDMPYAYHLVGLWDSTFEIKIITKSLDDMSELHDLLMITLQSTMRDTLQQNGLFIKSVRSSGEGTETYGANDPYFTTNITIDALSEWRRTIPIYNLVERVSVCFSLDIDLGDVPPSEHIKFNL